MCHDFSFITIAEAQTAGPGPLAPTQVCACLSPRGWVASDYLGNSTMTLDFWPLPFTSRLPGEVPASSRSAAESSLITWRHPPPQPALEEALGLIHPSFMHQDLLGTDQVPALC